MSTAIYCAECGKTHIGTPTCSEVRATPVRVLQAWTEAKAQLTAERVRNAELTKLVKVLDTSRLRARLVGLCEGFNAGAKTDVREQEREIGELEDRLRLLETENASLNSQVPTE